MSEQAPDLAFVFLAGSSWLDFVNTELIRDDAVVDLLGSITDFETWVAQAKLCDANSAAGRYEGFGTNARCDDALRQAKAFRRQLRAQAERFVAGHSASRAFIQLLNNHLAAGVRRPAVREAGQGFDLRFELSGPIDTKAVLSLLAESAAHYLAQGQTSRLKSCEHERCILFFYDTSKNSARRWCSMATCGNRAKAKAHYARKRHSPGA